MPAAQRAPAAPAPFPPPPPAQQGYGPPTYGPAPYGPAPYGPAPYGPPQGHLPTPYGPPGRSVHAGMLAAAVDRERTMDVLKAAFAEGRLTKGEFDQRAGRVLAGRTYADLHALVADLPAGPGVPGPVPAPYQAGYYQPLNIRTTNGYAVAALIFGIFPLFCGIPAVILGHTARGQIRKSEERGDALALTGLILGYLWISLFTLLFLLLITHGGGGSGPAPGP